MNHSKSLKNRINPLHANDPFLHPLKTFSGGIEMGHWREKG